LLAWWAAAVIISRVSFSLETAALLAITSLLVAPFLYPVQSAISAASRLPASELLARMAAGAALTLLVTTSAQSLGTAWSGIAALAPVLSPVLAVFAHRRSGGDHAIALFKGLVRALYALAMFCFVVAWQIAELGTARAFGLAIVAALCVQAVTYFLRIADTKPRTTLSQK